MGSPLRPLIYHDHTIRIVPGQENLLQQCEESVWTFSQVLHQADSLGDHATLIGIDMMVRWRQAGRRVYVIGPHLQKMFGETSLKGVTKDHLCPPFNDFYVALPGNTKCIWGGERTHWHQVAGVHVRYVEGIGFSFLLWGKENDKSVAPGDDATHWFSVNWGKFKESEDIESYLARRLTNPALGITETTYGPTGIEIAIKLPEDERRGQIVDTDTTLVRIIVNMILYLTTGEPETGPDPHTEEVKSRIAALRAKAASRKVKKAKKLLRQAANAEARLSQAKLLWLAPSIEWVDGGQRSSSGPRAYHWVRGHWKRQRTKTGMILKWIRPYERNKGSPRRSRNVSEPGGTHAS